MDRRIILLLMITTLCINPVFTWWDTSWVAKQPKSAYNSTTIDKSDMEIFLNVTYDSDMQNDFDDLRFVFNYSYLNTSLPFLNWDLEEGTGTTIGDDSDNNNDGTLYGGSWNNTYSKIGGYSLRFEDGDGYIETTSYTGSPNGIFSFSAWIRPDNLPADLMMVATYMKFGSPDYNGAWQVRISSTGALYFQCIV